MIYESLLTALNHKTALLLGSSKAGAITRKQAFSYVPSSLVLSGRVSFSIKKIAFDISHVTMQLGTRVDGVNTSKSISSQASESMTLDSVFSDNSFVGVEKRILPDDMSAIIGTQIEITAKKSVGVQDNIIIDIGTFGVSDLLLLDMNPYGLNEIDVLYPHFKKIGLVKIET